MDRKAQAGLEYLLTYGWAIVIMATVVGVLVLVASTPYGQAMFSSDDPTKLMVKGGTIANSRATIKLQNVTGGIITISQVTSTGGYSNCSINPTEVKAGGEVEITCDAFADPEGTVLVEFTDYAGLERRVRIRGMGPPSSPGSGTPGDPFKVSDCTALQGMKDDLSAHYTLIGNVDCSGFDAGDGKGFEPVGSSSNKFTGSFDGKGYTISGLHIERGASNYVGLFGVSGPGSEITNVGLASVNISGNMYVGGLVGANNGNVSNSHSAGSVNGGDRSVGGLIGRNEGGNISDSYATGSVTGGDFTGGLIGDSLYSTISDCYFEGTVNGDIAPWASIGGLIGWNYGTVTRSYSKGSVTGPDQVGGLLGYNYGNVNNSYSTMQVNGNSYVGGFIGMNDTGITNCYSAGSVTGSGFGIGGLVGSGYGSCSNCFWDKDASGQNTSDCGIGKTTAEMKQQATFVGWDFVSTWAIAENESYPYLK